MCLGKKPTLTQTEKRPPRPETVSKQTVFRDVHAGAGGEHKEFVKAGSTMAADSPGQLQRIPLAAAGSRQIRTGCADVLHSRHRS